MAETLLSPGILTRENDQTLITQGPITAGTAILGPTVKGPVNIPTLVTSYSDYKNKFGAAFESASIKYEYLTSIAVNNYFQQGGETVLLTRIVSGTFLPSTGVIAAIGTGSGDYTTASFTLETLSQGAIMNNSGSTSISGSLVSGSGDNVRFEIANVDSGSGQFNLLIRQGNDTNANKVILESWPGLSLDPNSDNYIERVIGNQRKTFSTIDGGQINITGSFINNSKYVRVSAVNSPTFDYFDNEGDFKPEFTQSLPKVGSGSYLNHLQEGAFSGAKGNVYGNGANGNTKLKMFEEIDVSSIQGLEPAYYTASISLLQNQDEYDYELLVAPGITIQNGAGTVTSMIDTVTNRGDAMTIVDTRDYGSTVSQAVTNALPSIPVETNSGYTSPTSSAIKPISPLLLSFHLKCTGLNLYTLSD